MPDGTVWTFGRNDNGQLGDGTIRDKLTPVQVLGLSDVIAISAGGLHTIALKDDGTVWTWGSNIYGQLGDGSAANRRTTAVQVISLRDVIAIAGGGYHSLVLKSDGTVWTWGNNVYGQLGDRTRTSRNTPVQVRFLGGVTAIAGGGYHSMALESNGTVWTWGYNKYGQLGVGDRDDRSIPVEVGAEREAVVSGEVISEEATTASDDRSFTVTQETGVISGYVSDREDNALEGVTVDVGGIGVSGNTETDDNGYYRITNLESGGYTLIYEKADYRTKVNDIILGDGEGIDLGVTILETSGKVHGRVVDDEGNPMESVKLKIRGKKTMVQKTTTSDVGGYFEFGGLGTDTYVITARKSGYKSGRQTIQLEDGGEEEIEVRIMK